MPTKASVHQYATDVATILTRQYGFKSDLAIRTINAEERYIHRSFNAMIKPSYVAKRIATGHVGHASGKSARKPTKNEGIVPEALIPGRRPGHAGDVAVVPQHDIVCVSDAWQPGVFLPADDFESRTVVLEDSRDGLSSGQISIVGVEERAGKRAVSTGVIPALLEQAKDAKNPKKREDAIDKLASILGQRSSHGGRVVAPTKQGPVGRGASWISGGAYLIEKTGNKKLKKELATVAQRVGTEMDERPRRGSNHLTATTYTSISGSCPSTCALMGAGGGRAVAKDTSCYALMHQNVGPLVKTLNGIVDRLGESAEAVAHDEANVIDASFRRGFGAPTDMRIHTAGDSRTRAGTRLIAAAVHRWQQRGGGSAWGYTHAWKTVHRADWGPVSTLASVQSVAETREAKRLGWMPTMVVKHGEFTKLYEKNGKRHVAFQVEGDDTWWIPCPAQHPNEDKQIACVNCRICMNDQRYVGKNMGVAFEAHGSGGHRATTYKHGEELVAAANKRHLTIVR